MLANLVRVMELVGSVIYFEVKKRGGRVEISSRDILPLWMQSWRLSEEGDRMIFTLEPSSVVRSPDEYEDRVAYRLEMGLMYLVGTSAGGRLIVEKRNPGIPKFDLMFEALPNDCLALVADSLNEVVNPGDRVLKIDGEQVVVVDGTTSPGGRVN